MLNKAIHFIKYNNITVLILAILFLLSTGVFAQTETGKAVIGAKQTNIEGVDNTLLLEADLDNLDMDFKIEKIESDDPSTSSLQSGGQAAKAATANACPKCLAYQGRRAAHAN